MKLKNLFLMAALIVPATVFFTSCNDNDEPNPDPTPDIPKINPNEPFAEDDEVVYLCDFQDRENINNLVSIYNLSNLTPANSMIALGFEKDKPCWRTQLQDDLSSDNYFAGCTSQFKPAGQANAWMVTTQITIPAEGYILSWKSEALSIDKRDGLKVFISTTGGNPEANFSQTPEWEIEAEESGPTELLDGEWNEHKLPLDKYAGQSIWIAFVNQSVDKCILCIDDICVKKEISYLLASATDKATAEDAITIKGQLTAKKKEITGYTVYYTMADSTVRTQQYSGLSIQPGESHTFEFSEKMETTEKGKYMPYKIWADVEGLEKVGTTDSIAVFAFNPKHKVVLEEGTGTWCGWCPLGMLAIENLQKLYPDNLVAIAVHNQDAMVVAEYDAGLRFPTFPNGIINRKYYCSPMNDANGYSFEGNNTFLNRFEQALTEVQFVEPSITRAQLTDNKILVKTDIKFAFPTQTEDYQIIYVITENDVLTKAPQKNYLSPYDYPIFGKFGKDGEFGSASIKNYKFQEVARGIYPSFKGVKMNLPATPEINKSYPLEYTVDLSDATIDDTDKLHIAVMIVNGKDGVILNADQTKVTK